MIKIIVKGLKRFRPFCVRPELVFSDSQDELMNHEEMLNNLYSERNSV